jgi:hypothetical protein
MPVSKQTTREWSRILYIALAITVPYVVALLIMELFTELRQFATLRYASTALFFYLVLFLPMLFGIYSMTEYFNDMDFSAGPTPFSRTFFPIIGTLLGICFISPFFMVCGLIFGYIYGSFPDKLSARVS